MVICLGAEPSGRVRVRRRSCDAAASAGSAGAARGAGTVVPAGLAPSAPVPTMPLTLSPPSPLPSRFAIRFDSECKCSPRATYFTAVRRQMVNARTTN